MRAVKARVAKAEGGENEGRDNSLFLGVTAVQSLGSPKTIRRVAKQFGQYMLKRREGESAALAKSLVRGNKAEAKQQTIRLFVYKLSNNLIEDEDDKYIEDHGKNDVIINMFQDIDLSMGVWKDHFTKALEEPTGRAFIDNLFDAAINTSSLDILETLLEVGADPHRILCSWMMGLRARPVQVAVDCRVIVMLTLLIRFGADVDLTTEDSDVPALRDAAKECTVDFVRTLIEARADIRAWT